ncbi:hypothetical protein ACFQ3R_04265 [Mesonia ostreae]|uniref:Cardiolipin synthase N-terminal domain-containing protein n=1 Tax=Mesonia ostreae TaxID=861110 RepID=A0ABU2KIU0_9FLAO|nr:hypothetical protein [Mesonia ostreae]MDT0294636.1 hypothetical protein [Mesonia ostreae]
MNLVNPIFLIAALIVALVFIVGSLFLILKNEKDNLTKVLWILIVLVFLMVGSAVYYVNYLLNKQKQSPVLSHS